MKSPETVFLVRKNSLHDRRIYNSPEEILSGYKEVANADNFYIYYHSVKNEVMIRKRDWNLNDFRYRFFIETTFAKNENGVDKSENSGFIWDTFNQIIVGNDAFMKIPLPTGELQQLRIGQYYFDYQYVFPWAAAAKIE